MTQATHEKHVDHEVRIRLLENFVRKIDSKITIAMSLIVGSIILPVFFKIIGWV
jgi:hypothetical protein